MAQLEWKMIEGLYFEVLSRFLAAVSMHRNHSCHTLTKTCTLSTLFCLWPIKWSLMKVQTCRGECTGENKRLKVHSPSGGISYLSYSTRECKLAKRGRGLGNKKGQVDICDKAKRLNSKNEQSQNDEWVTLKGEKDWISNSNIKKYIVYKHVSEL